MAKEREKRGVYTFLNAGRGNPNWTASTPRQAFFTLGQFAIPDRMLKYIEEVVYVYLMKEMSGIIPKEKTHDLFAVEGGTAAMCYIFDTLIANHLLTPKDHIALMVPIFTPYLEIPELSRYQFQVTYIHANRLNEEGRHDWQYPKEEIDQLANTDIKALFVVNPSNPPSVAIDDETIEYLKSLIQKKNPDLMIITDDVYDTFADEFKSLMTEIPYNTIGVHSYSKYFGVTGWRLGIIAVCKDNVFEKLLTKLPTVAREDVENHYKSLS